MDSDVLVGVDLSDELISLGRKFLAALDQDGLRVKAMFWQRCPVMNEWNLNVVFADAEDWDPLPDTRQLIRVYRQQVELRNRIGGLGLASLMPSDIRYREMKECLDWNDHKAGLIRDDLYVYRAN